MFRVYDNKEKKWVRGVQYLAKNGDLLMSESKMFGNEKTSLMSETRYTWHQDIGFEDKNGRLIYEGDVCNIKTADKIVECVVAYIPSYAGFKLVSEENNELVLYDFFEEAHELIEVVSNVFDRTSGKE